MFQQVTGGKLLNVPKRATGAGLQAYGTSEGVRKGNLSRPHKAAGPGYGIHDNIRNGTDLENLMKSPQYMDGGVYTVSVGFARAYVRKWASPSKIGYNTVGDSPMYHKGYWRMGKLIPFNKGTQIKYQNSALGAE